MQDITRYLTWANCKRLIQHTECLRDKVFFSLAVSTGRRIGELINIRIRDINIEEGTILWFIEKKRKEYKVVKHVPKMAWEPMLDYIMTLENPAPEAYLFQSTYTDRPLTTQRWRQILHKLSERYNILTEGQQRPRIHDLRHSCGVQIYNKTNDIRVVQRVLEHKDYNMSAQYARISTKDTEHKLEGVFE